MEQEHIEIAVTEQDGTCTIKTNLWDHLPKGTCKRLNTESLAMAFEPEQHSENPDGTAIIFDRDYDGRMRGEKTTAGPWEV